MNKKLALAYAVVLLLTCITTAIAAEEVSPLANCAHANPYLSITKPYYKKVDAYTHMQVETHVYKCLDCGTVFWTHDVPLSTGDHDTDENGKCTICGYSSN